MGKLSIFLPKHPNPDKIIAAGILLIQGKARDFKLVSMLPHERWRIPFKNSVPIGLDVNFRQINWRSYTEVVVSEHKIPRTPEIQRLVRLSDKSVRHQSEIGSLSDLINAWYSAQYWHRNREDNEFLDEKIVEEGIECVRDLIYFVQKGLTRDDAWITRLIKKQTRNQRLRMIPHRLYKYLKGKKVECGVDEILIGRRARKGEIAAQQLAAKIVRGYRCAYLTYGEALRIVREESLIKWTGGKKVIVAVTDNPVFAAAASGAITIQKLSSGHVQIFLAPNIPKKISDDLTGLLRAKEFKLWENESSLVKEREGPEVPKWFYVRPPYGGTMILNGSITTGTELIVPTRIPLMTIIDYIDYVVTKWSIKQNG